MNRPTDDELCDMYLAAAKDAGELFSQSMSPGLRAVYEAGVAAATAALASERVAIMHVAMTPDMETRAELVSEGFAAAMAQMAAPEGRESDAEDWVAERIAEAVAAERERILGQIEWLMNARNEYTDERVHEHMHVVENLLRVLRGADFAAEGWLPSWRWDEWAAIRADREPEPAAEARERACPENEYCDPHTCRVCSTSPIRKPRPCANCGERIIWLDAMWMHETGKLFCPGGEPVGMMAAPATEEGSNRG